MALSINTNVQSLAAQRALGSTNASLKSSLEKMASGQRIYRAADDAAGLAVSENLRAQIRSIRQQIRNGNDGISMIQTAEGAMTEIGNILVRFRELSIQAASDTVGDTERGFIDKEVRQLAAEADRITQSTEFNGRQKLLNGEGGLVEIQIGAHNDPDVDRFQLDQSQTDVRLSTLGVFGITVATKQDAQENLTRIDGALSELMNKRSTLGAYQNRLQSGINALEIYHENISAARSRIYDLDYASESAELTRKQILSQVGTSVLAQTNQTPMQVMKLIG